MITSFTKEEVAALEAMKQEVAAAAKKMNIAIHGFNRVVASAYVDVMHEHSEYDQKVKQSRELLGSLWDRLHTDTKRYIEEEGVLWATTEHGKNLAYWKDLLNHFYEVEPLTTNKTETTIELQVQEDLSHRMEVPTSFEELENRF